VYNLHSKCLMKCLNEFFIDYLIFFFYGVGLKELPIVSRLKHNSMVENLRG